MGESRRPSPLLLTADTSRSLPYSQGVSMLWVRPIARPQWRRLAGTEGAAAPFWSPDSRVHRIFRETTSSRPSGSKAVRRGALCEAALAKWSSGAWNRGGVIVFGASVRC